MFLKGKKFINTIKRISPIVKISTSYCLYVKLSVEPTAFCYYLIETEPVKCLHP